MPEMSNNILYNPAITYVFLLIITVLGWVVMRILTHLEKKLDEVFTAIAQQIVKNEVNTDEHAEMFDKLDAHGRIIRDHEGRIIKIEMRNKQNEG